MLGVIARHWRSGVLVVPRAEAGQTQTALPLPTVPSSDAPQATAHAAVATLTVCPECHGPYLQRSHRHSQIDRWRTRITRRYPVRCAACGWTSWVSAPILVRFSSGTETPSDALETKQFERIDPDE